MKIGLLAIARGKKYLVGRKIAFSLIASAALAIWTAGPAFASGWALQPTPSTAAPADLNGVSCVSPTDCEAVGYAAAGYVAEGWNGSTWTVQAQFGSQLGLEGVSCVSARRPADC